MLMIDCIPGCSIHKKKQKTAQEKPATMQSPYRQSPLILFGDLRNGEILFSAAFGFAIFVFY